MLLPTKTADAFSASNSILYLLEITCNLLWETKPNAL